MTNQTAAQFVVDYLNLFKNIYVYFFVLSLNSAKAVVETAKIFSQPTLSWAIITHIQFLRWFKMNTQTNTQLFVVAFYFANTLSFYSRLIKKLCGYLVCIAKQKKNCNKNMCTHMTIFIIFLFSIPLIMICNYLKKLSTC